MIQFILSNLGTVIISLVLASIVAFVIRKMIKDKKQGKGCCGSSCGGCGHSSGCHQDK
ncbi:attachment p12 family protein [Lachnotalea glycerini]|uniref:Attachment p12 family protein n=1 Tax=Lachnotalea glycerini TaxID=1763509 RepID=A0A318ETC1_9FIRM|nr:FeoB-associated Cys-rich membrane protein [Lachnotalea glycerini]PXV96159.1 attachment p12 family protein [Lachnotalea glycerini]